MNKTPIAVALERQIPEHIREEYALFVDFIKAYYAFLEETQQRDLEDIRSIDRTLDEFIIRFKRELSLLFPTTGLEDERFILQRLREFYKSRGSKESYQFLFRAFFNRDAEIQYPSTQILRASDGKWQQEKSIFVEAYSGIELFELAGKIIKIKTAKKHIDVYCPRVKYYRAGIYEVFIDRAYTSDISINDVVSYDDTDVGTINPVPAKYTIVRSGSGFEVGKLYNLPSESGDGSIIKITKIDSNGGIKKIQIISFGLDYETTFFAKLSNTYYQPLEYFHPVSSATIGSGHPAGLWPTSTFDRGVVDEEGNLIDPENPGAYGDTSLGYTEYGYINRNDYFLYQADYKGSNNILDITESDPDNEANTYFADGTYVGEIIASFYTNASNLVVIDETLAEIQIDLGAVAVYPGYYSASDGFISDEIYIQDGKYYQLFSYVLKVEEQLDTYSELIKSLLHPAGFELFAQYNIKNEFLVSAVPLEAFVRYQYFERRFARDASYWAMHKDIANSTPAIDNFVSYNLDRTGIDDTTQPYDTYRNLAQTGIHLNKWDITMGKVGAPLEDSTYTAVGNFENRVLGDVDTMQWGRTLGDFIDSVAETITGRAIVKGVSTEAPIEAATAAAVNGNGLDWAFAGETWTDITGSVVEVRASAENPTVFSLPKSDVQAVGDFFDRADASSSNISYNFDTTSTVTVSGTTYYPMVDKTGLVIDSVPLREANRQLADTTNTLTDVYNYTFSKLKQPQLLGLTATLVAGSKEVTLIGSGNVNTMVGLRVYKVSGTGEFGRNGTYTFNTGGDYSTAQSRYPQYYNLATSGGGILTSPTTSINVFGSNTPTLASRGIEFDTTNIQLRSTDGKAKILIVSDTWRYNTSTTSSVISPLSPYRTIIIPADGSYVSGGTFAGSSTPVYGYGVVSILDVTDNARIDVVNGTDITKFTVDVAHLVSGSVTFYVEASSSETEIADLNGYVTAAQSNGITWELGSISSPNTAFIQTASSVDNIPRDNIVIPWDRSTIPLEQTSVSVSSIGLGWDISGFNAFSTLQTASANDIVGQRDIAQTYAAETVSVAQSGNNWTFGTDEYGYACVAFSDRVSYQYNYTTPSSPYIYGNSGGAAAADITINLPLPGSGNTALSSVWLKVSVGNTPANTPESMIMDLIRTPLVLSGSNYDGDIVRSTYGDINNSGTFSSADAQNVLAYFAGTNTNPTVTAGMDRFLQLLRRAMSGNTMAGHDIMVAAGYYTYTLNINKDISRTLGDSINTNNPGTLYYNPYNIDSDASSVSSYNSGGTYFALDTRAI